MSLAKAREVDVLSAAVTATAGDASAFSQNQVPAVAARANNAATAPASDIRKLRGVACPRVRMSAVLAGAAVGPRCPAIAASNGSTGGLPRPRQGLRSMV